MVEVFRPVADPDFRDLYEVSNHGIVRKTDGTVLTPSPSGKNRRLQVKLRAPRGLLYKTVMLHRLVACTFLGPTEGRIVYFRDKNTANCRADNLYYGAKPTSKYGSNGGGRRAKFEGPIAILSKRIFAELMPETTESLAALRESSVKD